MPRHLRGPRLSPHVSIFNYTAPNTGRRARKRKTPYRNLSSPLLLNPPIDLLLQELQRDAAGFEHFVVEFADVETRAELLFRAGAQFADFQLANFVRKCLAG